MFRTKFRNHNLPMVISEIPSLSVAKNKFGPKCKCTEAVCEETAQLIGLLGATNKDLAAYFDVSVCTIEYWAKTYPEFARAQKRGRMEYGMKVSNAFAKKATGFYVQEVQIMQHQGQVIKVPYMKYYPPDAWACKQYLSIMFRETWADPSIRVEHGGTIQHEHRKIEDIPASEFSEQEQDMLVSIGMKQLRESSKN